jgi:hypothetical protein
MKKLAVQQHKIETGTNYKSKGQIFCNDIPKLQNKDRISITFANEYIALPNSAHV